MLIRLWAKTIKVNTFLFHFGNKNRLNFNVRKVENDVKVTIEKVIQFRVISVRHFRTVFAFLCVFVCVCWAKAWPRSLNISHSQLDEVAHVAVWCARGSFMSCVYLQYTHIFVPWCVDRFVFLWLHKRQLRIALSTYTLWLHPPCVKLSKPNHIYIYSLDERSLHQF